MILNIKHQTNYHFYSSVPRLVQSLKLYPSNCKNQKVINWNISTSIGQLIKSHQDALGHTIYNIYNECLTNKWEITNINKPLNGLEYVGINMKPCEYCKTVEGQHYHDLNKNTPYDNWIDNKHMCELCKENPGAIHFHY